MSELENSKSLSSVDTPIGVQPTLERIVADEYKTCNGTIVYDKILTGFKPILFPTAVSRNSCFEYRFSIKDLILPKNLPKVTDLYFKDLVVKIQDMFTQVQAQESIRDGIVYSYMPYSAVLSQDCNGIEVEEHKWAKGDILEDDHNPTIIKCINSDRLVKRDASPLFVVSSNLKYNRSLNLDITSNSYKALAIYNEYKDGKFVGKVVKSVVSIPVNDLKELFEKPNITSNFTGFVCLDVILCDILIFCLKSFNLDEKTAFLDNLTKGDVDKANPPNPIPISWLTAEEKLKRYGNKGTYMETFGEQNPLPNNLFQLVDMQERCDKIFTAGRPKNSVFLDKNHIVADFDACYSCTSELISIRVKSDN